MLETEIKKTGEVMTEGHVIGRLEGFSFTPDSSADGSEAKALQAAARSSLAGEIDARARKLSQAPDREIILTVDGTLRWIGEAVAKLAAGDDVLRPRVRVIADEHLSGAPRDAVQTRLDVWLKTHVERLLNPLFVLTLAEDVTGIARGISFQLVEALGVLERQKVSEDIKALDQPARATLRKHGVRFGAYHIYIPALLKPAPRSLAVQLWALKHGGPEHGLENLQLLAASGRTSIPVDPKMPKLLYRTVGYHVCGARAIRVDILERLADLIRPALVWRVGTSSTRPAGAYDGRAFTVTGAMTSLTGASGEDFASILRALGYRMEKRPKPVEPAVVAPTAESPTPAVASEPVAEVVKPADMPVAEPAAHSENGTVLLPVPDYSPAESALVAPAVESAPSLTDAPAEVAAESSSTPPAQNADGSSQAEVPIAAALAVAEPEMIEIWLPGRPDGPRRKREDNKREEHKRPRRRRERSAPAPQSEIQPAGEAQTATASTPSSAPAQAEARPHSRRPRREPEPDGERKEKQGRPRASAPGRDGRPERKERGHGEGRGERFGRGRERRDRDDGNREPRTWSSTDTPRGKEPDPNSPFAKLLALKEQLETNAKERR